MNVFELWGSLGLDASEFSEGLSSATGKVTSFKNIAVAAFQAVKKADKFLDDVANVAITNASKIVASAIDIGKAVDENIVKAYDEAAGAVGKALSTVVNATAKLGKSSFQEGLGFDAAMGQVQATAGLTADEFEKTTVKVGEFTGTLREYAEEMGRTTKFTSTEAGQALNELILAGFKAQDAAELLPDVLNYATAGGIDLAESANVITAAQKALGVSVENITTLIDQMAKTSTSSATNLQQLGDAVVTLGANGRDLSGGITEVNTLLAVLADNGVKASEGGNALRRVLVRLTAPNEKSNAKQYFDAIGLSAYDAADNLRPLPEIFQELSEKMAKMTPKQRDRTLVEMFGQYALSTSKALINTTPERWNELTKAIENADNAAEQMAETQRSTLPGMITLMESALSAVKLSVYEKIAPTAKDLVEQFTDGLSNAAEAIKKGDVKGAFIAVGDTIGSTIETGIELFTKNTGNIITFADYFVEFLGNSADTILDAVTRTSGTVIGVGSAVGTKLISGIADWLGDEENISRISTNITYFFAAVSEFFENNEKDLQTIFSTIFDFAVQIFGELFVTKRETVYNIISPKIQEIIDKLPELIAQLLTNADLNKAFDGAINFIEDLAQYLIDNADTIVPTIMRFLSNVADKTLTALSGVLGNEDNIKKITDAIKFALDEVEKFYDEHEDEISDIIGAIVDVAITVIPKVWAIKRELAFDAVWVAITEIFDKIGEKIQKWSTTAAKEGDYITESLKTFGKNVVNGIWEGIKRGWEEMTNGFPTLVAFLVEKLQNSFDIHSPSKLTRDKIGVFLAQGIGVGFSEEMQNVMEDINNEIPTDFDISQEVTANATARGAGQNIFINIDTVNGTTREDAYNFAETVSRALAGELYREKAAVI